MHAEDLMSHPAVTCHVNEPLNVAAQLMWEHDCGAVAVVNDDGTLVGMVTDRDICMAAYTQGRALDEMLVNTAMCRHLVSTHASESIGNVEQLMARHQIRRIPVIDSDGKPVGIISLNDLARESVQPDSGMKLGPTKVAHTLAAICTPRLAHEHSA